MLTQERLKSVIHYDSDTGVFTWIKTKSNGAKKGSIAGCIGLGYWKIKIDKRNYYAQQLAWLYVYGKFPTSMLDHFDQNKLNNKIDNLREVTHKENQQNVTKPLSSNKFNLRGVSFHKATNKYRAQISIDGKTKHIGVYDTPEAANEAYFAVKAKVHIETIVSKIA